MGKYNELLHRGIHLNINYIFFAFQVAVFVVIIGGACALPQQFINFDELETNDDGTFSDAVLRDLAEIDLYDVSTKVSDRTMR